MCVRTYLPRQSPADLLYLPGKPDPGDLVVFWKRPIGEPEGSPPRLADWPAGAA